MTEKHRLEKTREKNKPMLDERRKKNWKNFTGITENSRTATVEYSNCFKLVNLLDRGKPKLMRSSIDIQPEINQDFEEPVQLEHKNIAYNMSQNGDENGLSKEISQEDANSSSDVLLAKSCATLDIMVIKLGINIKTIRRRLYG